MLHFRGAPRRLRSRSESAAGRDGAGAFKKSNLRTTSRLLRPAPPHWTRMVATIRRKGFAAIRRRVRAHVIDQKGCDLGCGSIGVKQQCCGKRVCETCALNLVRVRSPVGLATTCQIACPFLQANSIPNARAREGPYASALPFSCQARRGCGLLGRSRLRCFGSRAM